ncbi:MAG TPA: hypothetical protein VN790_03265, partial [Steroidobacteraceae bacterium]|nr:hypothetical protein [Steroidobacteraceae bacterium]
MVAVKVPDVAVTVIDRSVGFPPVDSVAVIVPLVPVRAPETAPRTPPTADSVIGTFGSTALLALSAVAVIVDVVDPSARIDAGDADTIIDDAVAGGPVVVPVPVVVAPVSVLDAPPQAASSSAVAMIAPRNLRIFIRPPNRCQLPPPRRASVQITSLAQDLRRDED